MRLTNQMWRFVIGCFAAATILGCEPDTSSSPEPEDVFIKFYGNAGQEVAANVLALGAADSAQTGYAIFGSTTSDIHTEDANGEDADYYLILTDLGGNEIFSRGYDVQNGTGEADNRPQTAVKVIQTVDGGFLMAGTASFDISDPDNPTAEVVTVTRAHFIKVSNDGTREWSITYPDRNDFNFTEKTTIDPTATPTASQESVSDVIQTNDGSILFIGTSSDINTTKSGITPTNAASDPNDIWIVKFIPSGLGAGTATLTAGDIDFERKLGFPGNDEGSAIFEQPDGSLVLIGNGPGPLGTDTDILFATSDSRANNDNFQEIGSDDGSDDIISEVKLLSDGGVVVVGYSARASGDETMLARFSSSGGLEFFENPPLFFDNSGNADTTANASNFTSTTGIHRGYGIVQTLNGDLVIVGEVEDVSVVDPTIAQEDARRIDILLLGTDGFGRRDGSSLLRNFGGILDDRGEDITQIQDPDGTLRLLILSTVDFEGGSTVISLMKTSTSGSLVQ